MASDISGVKKFDKWKLRVSRERLSASTAASPPPSTNTSSLDYDATSSDKATVPTKQKNKKKKYESSSSSSEEVEPAPSKQQQQQQKKSSPLITPMNNKQDTSKRRFLKSRLESHKPSPRPDQNESGDDEMAEDPSIGAKHTIPAHKLPSSSSSLLKPGEQTKLFTRRIERFKELCRARNKHSGLLESEASLDGEAPPKDWLRDDTSREQAMMEDVPGVQSL